MGIFVRNLNGFGIPSMQTVALRAFFTAVMICLFTLVYDRKLFKIRLRDCWCFIGTGLCSIVFFKEKFTPRKVIAAIAAFAGCALVTGAAEGSLALNGLGVLTGLGSAFGYALYTVFGQLALNRGYSSVTVTLYTFIFAAVGVLPFAGLPDLAGKISANPKAILWAAALAFFITVLPYLLYTLGLKTAEPSKASVMATVEPVTAALVGTFIFSEPMSGLGILGIALTVVSIVLLNMGAKAE